MPTPFADDGLAICLCQVVSHSAGRLANSGQVIAVVQLMVGVVEACGESWAGPHKATPFQLGLLCLCANDSLMYVGCLDSRRLNWKLALAQLVEAVIMPGYFRWNYGTPGLTQHALCKIGPGQGPTHSLDWVAGWKCHGKAWETVLLGWETHCRSTYQHPFPTSCRIMSHRTIHVCS